MTDHKIQTFKGREFKVVQGIVHPEYSYHCFEREERSFRDLFWDVKEGDVVFDVGASYGSYALTACAMGATVYAFEPERTVFDDLVRNVELNGWQDRCHVSDMALWCGPAVVDMRAYASHWPAHTISGPYRADSLDNFVEGGGIDRVDWIKVDVEGVEDLVIQGSLKTVGRFGPRLLVECHTFLKPQIADAVRASLLSARDFDFQEVDRDPCIMLIATPA